jgi:hypothetical protein
LILRLERHTKNVFKALLRGYFSLDPTYTWNVDLRTTKLVIMEFFNTRTRTYPQITVESVTGKAFYKSLNREFQETIEGLTVIDGLTRTGVIGYRHGGPQDLTVSLVVRDYDQVAASEIADKLDSALRFFIFENFRVQGIEIVDIRVSGVSAETIGNDSVHSVRVDVDIYTEWEEVISVQQSELLQKIKIPDFEGVITIAEDGTTDPYFSTP